MTSVTTEGDGKTIFTAGGDEVNNRIVVNGRVQSRAPDKVVIVSECVQNQIKMGGELMIPLSVL